MTNKNDGLRPLEWENTCDRFVAYLDVMGFKEWLYRSDHETVVTAMEKALGVFKGVLDELARVKMSRPANLGLSSPNRALVKAALFSDSMLLFTSDGSWDSAWTLLMTTSNVMWHAACHDIPMKGAIAFGRQTANFDRSLYVGIPLIDAYELQNDLLMYGVVLHHSAQRHLTEEKRIDRPEQTRLHKYRTPMRSASVDHYLLDCWHMQPGEESIGQYLDGILLKFYCSVSGSTRRYVDNTAEFCSWLRMEYERLSANKPSSGAA